MHVGPVNSSGQIQWKRFCPKSEHVPPFLQGLLQHGLGFGIKKEGPKILLFGVITGIKKSLIVFG